MEMELTSGDRSAWNDDAFTTLTIEECKKEFELCENDIDRFVDNKEKLSLLRSCIVLLNRLENTNEHLFAGRVLIFLARAIPLFDQSGVNARSDFNTKLLPRSVVRHLQEIAIRNNVKGQQIAQMIDRDMEEGETLSDDDSNDSPQAITTNNNTSSQQHLQEDADKLFERFWKMQQYLDQPNLIYDKNVWLTFRTQVASFVAKMEQPTKLKNWNLNSSYMTEPRSFCLQLNDVNMRRCFLVQLLIILQYFELPVETRSNELVLDRMHLDWAAKLTKKIYSILRTLPDEKEGREFLGLVRQILAREEIWNRWKNEKCKEPRQPDDDDEIVLMGSTYRKRRKISDEMSCAKRENIHLIGSKVMTSLWNRRQSQKFHQPALDTYLNIPEGQSETFKDPNVSFRLLRLLRRSPDFFTQTTNPIQNLDEYLKSLARAAYGKEEVATISNTTINKTPTMTTPTSSTPPSVINTSSTVNPITTPTTINQVTIPSSESPIAPPALDPTTETTPNPLIETPVASMPKMETDDKMED